MNQVALAKQAEERSQLRKAWLIHLKGLIPPVRCIGFLDLGDTTDVLVCQGYPVPLPMPRTTARDGVTVTFQVRPYSCFKEHSLPMSLRGYSHQFYHLFSTKVFPCMGGTWGWRDSSVISTALPEDSREVPKMPVWWLTASCDSSFRGPNAFLWPPKALVHMWHSLIQIHTYTQMKIIQSF